MKVRFEMVSSVRFEVFTIVGRGGVVPWRIAAISQLLCSFPSCKVSVCASAGPVRPRQRLVTVR
jgi:hypothetical protein